MINCTHIYFLVGFVVLLTAISCSVRESNEFGIGDDQVSTVDAPLSSNGVVKVIPLRFINLLDCNPASSGCQAWKDRYASILYAVEAANQVYKSADVQFWAKSVEAYQMPDFYDLRSSYYDPQRPHPDPIEKTWSSVRAQLHLVFPMISNSAWNSIWGVSTKKTSELWLRSVNTVVAAHEFPEEYIVWIVEYSDLGGASFAAFPEEGRMVVIRAAHLASTFKVAHELGHALGLMHTFEPDLRMDPSTGQPQTLADSWDLVFRPGWISVLYPFKITPHTYFSSKAEAAAFLPDLLLVNMRASNGVDNCSVAVGTGDLTCTIPACPLQLCVPIETHTTPAAALKGLAFKYSNAVNGVSSGSNLMSYHSIDNYPESVSDSQIVRIRKYLRWNVGMSLSAWWTINDGRETWTPLTANLALLGVGNTRPVASEMDFDCDGKRDIAIWEPATPSTPWTFKVLLSSKNFSTVNGQYMSVPLGSLGDIPVIGEMSGDCAADIGVFQPGGGINRNDPTNTQGYWRWCATNASNPVGTTCTSPKVIAFGTREDVPLPDLRFDAGSTRHLTIFRPREGKWIWARASDGVVIGQKTLGAPGSIPLPGLYDGDELTDLAVYQPKVGNFGLLRSETNWATPLWRSFGSEYVPLVGAGTTAQRSGAIPLYGMTRTHSICSGSPFYFCNYYPRQVFSLYYPEAGRWNTMWDPINSSTIDKCVFGSGSVDLPIPGVRYNKLLFTDLTADYAYYRGESYTTAGKLWFKKTTPLSPNSCSGASYAVSSAPANRPSVRMFAVSDLTGDGKPDIMVIDSESNVISWRTSESNFTVIQSRSFGTILAHVL